MDLATIARLANAVPSLTQLYGAVQRAQRGDPEALEYLKKIGCFEALDLLRPGAGTVAKQVVEQGQSAWSSIQGILAGNIIEGEAREVDGFPWTGFLHRLFAQEHSAHVVIGPEGSGKTQLALRLAQRLAQESNYTMEACNLYPNDVPSCAQVIAGDTFIARARKIRAYLKAQGKRDDEDDAESDAEVGATEKPAGQKKRPATLPVSHRVIVIDESGALIGTHAADPARGAALTALWERRHVKWHVIVIGQTMSQVPKPILGRAALWIKKPGGREHLTDRDEPWVRDYWQQAMDEFAKLHQRSWYGDPWRNDKSWALCLCDSLNGGPGYHGMVPFSMIDDVAEGEYEEIEDEAT